MDDTLTKRVQNLPIEVRYKIMSELPYSDLAVMSNKTLWNVYNTKWPHEKWDPSINWMDALLDRDAWLECRDKFFVRLPWILRGDWRAINRIAHDKPVRGDLEVFTYSKDVWHRIFNGDCVAYATLLTDILRCCEDDCVIYLLAPNELEVAFKTAAAAIYANVGEKRYTYFWMYVEMHFEGENYLYTEADAISIVSIADLFTTYSVDISTVIKRYLTFKYQTPDPLIYVGKGSAFYWDINYNIDKNTVVLTLLPYLKKDITPFGTERLPGESATIAAEKIRQFYGAISRVHW